MGVATPEGEPVEHQMRQAPAVERPSTRGETPGTASRLARRRVAPSRGRATQPAGRVRAVDRTLAVDRPVAVVAGRTALARAGPALVLDGPRSRDS